MGLAKKPGYSPHSILSIWYSLVPTFYDPEKIPVDCKQKEKYIGD
jgi:hypothetical protein